MRTLRTILTVLLLASSLQMNAQYLWEGLPRARQLRSKPDTVTLHLIGDVMMHAKQLGCDCHTFLRDIAPQMKAADVSIANMEFTLAGEPYSGYPAFSAPDSYAWYIAGDCGADVFLTANNHITDKAVFGMERTLGTYDRIRDSLGTVSTGVARDSVERKGNYPLILRRKDISIAIVNFTYGTNSKVGSDWPSVNLMREEDIREAFEIAKERNADFIIALPHWGNEYELHHSPSQEKWAHKLIEMGADAIVGSHPHVVQDTTHISGVPVIYSMGNAVSNMSAVNTRLELAVTLRFVHDPVSDSRHMLEPELEFLWCTLPGKLIPDSYATVRVKEWASRRSDWLNESDYLNMVETLERVKAATGIED